VGFVMRRLRSGPK